MTMKSDGHAGARAVPNAGSDKKSDLPAWTNGLRQLYDKVVDEDLPDSFRDLLARLDGDEK